MSMAPTSVDRGGVSCLRLTQYTDKYLFITARTPFRYRFFERHESDIRRLMQFDSEITRRSKEVVVTNLGCTNQSYLTCLGIA